MAIVETVEVRPEWPKWCVNPATGKRVKFDSPGEMWPGFQPEGKTEKAPSPPPPNVPAGAPATMSFKTGDMIMLDGEPFVLKRPAKPGRKPKDESPAS